MKDSQAEKEEARVQYIEAQRAKEQRAAELEEHRLEQVICLHAHMLRFMCTRTFTCLYADMLTCSHAHMHAYPCIYLLKCQPACMPTCQHADMLTCWHADMLTKSCACGRRRSTQNTL